MQVLIVDDNNFELSGMKKLVQKTFPRASVETVNNGFDALKLAAEKNYDLVITDIKMPNITGDTLIQTIRKTNHDVKLLVVSGYENFSVAKNLLPMTSPTICSNPLTSTSSSPRSKKLCSRLKRAKKNIPTPF